MIKKKLKVLLGIIFVLNLIVIPATINATTISSWAVEEVEAAIENQIVPDNLKSNFQSEIKRYEYVLLANELLDLKKDEVTIILKYPFTDITNHPYEDEIVRAYNAGIIKGNGDGTFRPDDPINRQEIASLVVNLVKRLENIAEVNTEQKSSYADEASISNWAKGYINYCHNNNIMNGIGKDTEGKDRIDPIGRASREQAILLLYRLADNLQLFTGIDMGTISIVEYIDSTDSEVVTNLQKKYIESTKINDFATIFGPDIAEKVIELSLMDNVDILSIEDDYVLIDLINEGTINISYDGFGVDIKLQLKTLANTQLITHYVDLANVLVDSTALEDAIYRDLTVFESDEEHRSSLELSDSEYYTSRSEVVNSIRWYAFNYRVSN